MEVKPLLYKEDWPQARERLLAFWEHELVDRVCIGVTAPRPDRKLLPESTDIIVQQTDLDLHQARLHAEFGNHYYGGEALPISGTHLGYASFGGRPRFERGETGYAITDYVFVDPVIDDWDSNRWHFDTESKWTERFIEITRRECLESHGKYLATLGAVLAPTDVLGLLRGYGPLCLDLYANPVQVRQTQRELIDAYKWMHGYCFELTDAQNQGSTVMDMWGPGRNGGLTCDFSCLISAEQFREFVIPELVELSRSFDHTFYHLDGVDALQHLPALLEVEELDGIQFNCAAQHAHLPVQHWLPLYRRIQEAGKLVQIAAKYDEVEEVISELGPRGIFIATGAPSIEAAEELLDNAVKWSR